MWAKGARLETFKTFVTLLVYQGTPQGSVLRNKHGGP
jgi:hypothetical protein